jgi:hypothetical protein
MSSSPLTLLNICRAIRQTSQHELLSIDREMLLATRNALLELKSEVDSTLLRLSFVDERHLN